MNSANGSGENNVTLRQVVAFAHADYDGNNPQDSGVFVRMQEFAMAHPSTEEVFVTSVCGPMAGDLDTSAGFLEVRRWADERKDPKLERIRNLPLDNSPLPEYHPEITRIRRSDGRSRTAPSASNEQQMSAERSGRKIAASLSTATLLHTDKLLTPLEVIRQKHMNNCDKRASNAHRAMPSTSTAIDLNADDSIGNMIIALPKSQVKKKMTGAFYPTLFSTPNQPQINQKNPPDVRPSISPVLVQATPAAELVPAQDAHMMAKQRSAQPATSISIQVPASSVNAPLLSTAKKAHPSRIPHWSNAKKSIPTAIWTPRSRIAGHVSAAEIVYAGNTPNRPPQIPAAVAKPPIQSTVAPTVTVNLTVNNVPAVSQAPQSSHVALQQIQTNETNANASPINSNRVTSSVESKRKSHQSVSEPLLTDDDDDSQTDETGLPVWKTVANRHATPGVQKNDKRPSEPNKSMRRQLFQPRNNKGNQAKSIDEQQEPRRLVDDATAAAVDEPQRNSYEKCSVITEHSTTDRPLSQTYDKDESSLSNRTYDIMSSGDGGQSMQNNAPNIVALQTEEPESSGLPSEVVLDLNDQSNIGVHLMADGNVLNEANGGSDSSAAASSTASNIDNRMQILNVQSVHGKSTDRELNSLLFKAIKSPESTTTNNPTNRRRSQRIVLTPLPKCNNHCEHSISQSIATSTTDQLRESETFSSICPPPNFCDDPVITEHSPSTGRKQILQMISAKNKSSARISPPKSKRRRRRRNVESRSKTNINDESIDSNSDDEQILVSQNGRRILYTKGYSDCEDAEDASNTNANNQPSTSHAAMRELNQMNIETVASSSEVTSGKPNENISLKKNAIMANSTMNTLAANGTPHHLTDIAEESSPATNAAEIEKTTQCVKPKRAQKTTKPKAPKGAAVRRTRSSLQTDAIDTNVNNEIEANTSQTLRRSCRERRANPMILQIQKLYNSVQIKQKRKPTASREKETAAESANDAASKEKRRRVDSSNKNTNAPAANNTTRVHAKTRSKATATATTDTAHPNANHSTAYLCQMASSCGWFNDLCNPYKTMPQLTNQEGIYKILTNQFGEKMAESTGFSEIRYYQDGKIEYGFYPSEFRDAGVMRFHKGAIKCTSVTVSHMLLQVLHGTFEITQARKSMKVSTGIITIQPNIAYKIEYLGKDVGTITFNFYNG